MKTSSVFFIIGRRKVLPYSKNLWTASSDLANEGKVMIKQEYTLCEVKAASLLIKRNRLA